MDRKKEIRDMTDEELNASIINMQNAIDAHLSIFDEDEVTVTYAEIIEEIEEEIKNRQKAKEIAQTLSTAGEAEDKDYTFRNLVKDGKLQEAAELFVQINAGLIDSIKDIVRDTSNLARLMATSMGVILRLFCGRK